MSSLCGIDGLLYSLGHPMKRRTFLVGCGSLAVSSLALAQRRKRVAVLMGFPENDRQGQIFVRAFQEGLKDLGWVDGKNIEIDYRWAGGDPAKTKTLVQQEIARAPDVIVPSTNQVTDIVCRETKTIPVVFAYLGDPVGSGLVASMQRPGGNVTGFPVFVESMGSKWVELMKEALPNISRAGFMFHPDAVPNVGLHRAAQQAAPAFGVRLFSLPVRTAEDIEAAVSALSQNRGEAMICATHAVTVSNRMLLIDRASRTHIATLFGDRVFTESGGLLSYGSNGADLFRKAASYVDRILKGAKPGELPVQLPTNFELVINATCAKALGITLSKELLAQASEVLH